MQQAELSIMPLNNFCFDLADDVLESLNLQEQS